jgi:primary-amine oxidase
VPLGSVLKPTRCPDDRPVRLGRVSAASASAPHPLAPLTAEEITAFRAILAAAGLVTAATRFGYVRLAEPTPAQVRAWEADLGTAPVPRVAAALLTDIDTAANSDVRVDLTAGAVLSAVTLDPRTDGQGPVFDEEFPIADEIVKADAAWCAAIRARGADDLDKVRVSARSAGVLGYEDEVGVRVARVLAFWQPTETEPVWAHPISGVIAHVDLTNRKMLRLIETHDLPVPVESGDYLDPAVRGPERTTLKPIEITQPEGISFTLTDGNRIDWQNWELRVGFNGREGLTLHEIAFTDPITDGRRDIISRASVSEMVVPYADPKPGHNWQNYFDAGEYQYGRLANSLEFGCDCLGAITYLDATVADDNGNPVRIPNAICVHEEDYGTLWKHTDIYTGTKEVRRQRRLVISFFTTVGNYDYGFYWYLYLDGTIQMEIKATGVLLPSMHDGGDETYVAAIGPGLGAPYHQHLFCARLHMAVDGASCAVDEIDAEPVPMDPASNPTGAAFTRKITRLRSEAQAQRLANPAVSRVWRVSSTSRVNRMGRPTSYVLYPQGLSTLLAAEGAWIRKRARFATKHLWVTQYSPEELWAAGPIVNQHPGEAGLPAYAAADRTLDGADLVLWHVFGPTHFPRPEDWPVMPVDTAGFTLKPHGFFDRNPALDVPSHLGGHCTGTRVYRADHESNCHQHIREKPKIKFRLSLLNECLSRLFRD